MNKLNILKAVKVVASVAAVASAVAGTVVVVKAVRKYQEDSVNAINKAEAEGFETDEEAKEVTEKLQMDGLKVVAASVGTVAVSGIFALIAGKASKMISNEETRFIFDCFACSDANGHYCYDLLMENGIEYDVNKMITTTGTDEYMKKEFSDIRDIVESGAKLRKIDASGIIAQLDKCAENHFEK